MKAVKFRGHKSEGFFIPLTSLEYLYKGLPDVVMTAVSVPGFTFDVLGDHEICRKYVPKRQQAKVVEAGPKRKLIRLEDLIVPGQFELHKDTENLRRNAHKIMPTDLISITDKWHGTSVVISRPLVVRKLNLFERVLSKLGIQIKDKHYGTGLTYSSRRVLKDTSTGRWTNDIWGVVAKEVQDRIPNGFSLYGEIVGFEPDGKAIQAKYAYGCKPRKHKFVVYRVTIKSQDNVVVELSWPQVREFCTKYGLETVHTLYYGVAADAIWFSPIELLGCEPWAERFVKKLEELYVADRDCPFNAEGIPAEGVVVRIDRLHQAESYKLKSFRFLEGESKSLDKGVIDIETSQSELQEELAAA